MPNPLILPFKVDDKASKPIKNIKGELNNLNTASNKTVGGVKTLDSQLVTLTKTLVGTYVGFQTVSKGYDLVINRGLEYNKSIESQTKGLASILFATDKYINSLEDVTTEQERFNLATQMATDTMKELERINSNTPQTLEQTAKIYKAMLPSMQNLGASTEDLITLTEKLAIASDSAEIEFNSLLAGVDGLATGTVLANSDLGRFLSSIDLTNEALKNTDDVMETLLTSKLGKFTVDMDKMSVVTSKFNVEWDKLTGALTKDIFITQKESIKEVTGLIKQLNQDQQFMEDMGDTMVSLGTGLITFAEGTVQIIQGFRIIANTIEMSISQSMKFVELGFLGISKFIKEQILETEAFINSILDRFGVDKISFGVSSDEMLQLNEDMEFLKANIKFTSDEYSDQLETIGKQSLKFREIRDTLIDIISKQKESNDLVTVSAPNATNTVSLDDAFLESLDDYENINFKYLAGLEDLNGKALKEKKEADEKMVLDFSSTITSVLNQFAQTGSFDGRGAVTGIGSMMTGAGVGALGASMALNPAMAGGVIAGGMALQALSSRFGGGTTSPEEVINAYTLEQTRKHALEMNTLQQELRTTYQEIISNQENAFDSFEDALDKATSRLDSLGSAGDSFVNEFDSLTNQLGNLQSQITSGVLGQSGTEIAVGGAVSSLTSQIAEQNRILDEQRKIQQANLDWDIGGDGETDDLGQSAGGGSSGGDFATFIKASDAIFNAEVKLGKLRIDLANEQAKLSTATSQRLDAERTRVANLNAEINSLTEQQSDLLFQSVANSLDYTRLTTAQLQELTQGFNLEEYEKLLDDLNNLALLSKQQGGTITAQQEAEALEIYRNEIFLIGQNFGDALETIEDRTENFARAIENAGNNINDTIVSIRGNLSTATASNLQDYAQTLSIIGFKSSQGIDTTGYISDLTSMAQNISNTAFGDQDLIRQNLINSLEQAKLDIGFEEEVIDVRIIEDTTSQGSVSTPTVTVSNPTASSDERLAMLEALMTELVATQKAIKTKINKFDSEGIQTREENSRKILEIVENFEEEGIKTI